MVSENGYHTVGAAVTCKRSEFARPRRVERDLANDAAQIAPRTKVILDEQARQFLLGERRAPLHSSRSQLSAR